MDFDRAVVFVSVHHYTTIVQCIILQNSGVLYTLVSCAVVLYRIVHGSVVKCSTYFMQFRVMYFDVV